MLLATVVPVAAVITINTDKAVYEPGENVTASGTAAPNSAVSTRAYNPGGTLVAVAQTQVDEAGNWVKDVLIFPAAPTDRFPYGVYTLKAYAVGETATTTITFTSSTIPPTPTGKIMQLYAVAPSVTNVNIPITIMVYSVVMTDMLNYEMMGGASVTGKVVEPSGMADVTFTEIQAGSYKGSIKPAKEGSYIISLTAKKVGYTDGFAAVAFQALKPTEIDVDLAPITSHLAKQDAKIDSLKSSTMGEFGKLSQAITSMETKVTASVDKVNGAVSSVSSAIVGINSKLDSNAADVKNSINAIKDSVATSESAVKSSVDKAVTTLKGSIDDVKSSLDAKTSDLTEAIKSSSTDLSTYLMAISILVVITLILTALVFIRSRR
jgi:copper chaperone CopZ